MREIAKTAAEALRDERQFDFITGFSSKFTVRVLFAVLGLPLGDEQTVRDKAVLMVQSNPNTHAKAPEHIAAYDWMQDYAARVIAERRARARKSPYISHFSTAEIDGDKLDEREVLLTTTTLIIAGIESLGGFMSMLALNLADYPEARRAVVANPALLADAVEIAALQHLRAALSPRPEAGRDLARPDHARRRFRLPRLRLGQPRRAPVCQPRRLRHRAQAARPSRLRRRRPRLPSARRSPAWRSRSPSRNSTRWCRTMAGRSQNWPGCHPSNSASRWRCNSRCIDQRRHSGAFFGACMAKITNVAFGGRATTINVPASPAIDGLTVNLQETRG